MGVNVVQNVIDGHESGANLLAEDHVALKQMQMSNELLHRVEGGPKATRAN